MKDFFRKDNRFGGMAVKIAIGVVVGILIVGGVIYFWPGERPGEENEGVCLAPAEGMVTKVIDGDTVVVEGGEHIRLLGIDADESGSDCYQEAKKRLEELVLNQEVRLEKDVSDVDQYNRCLRYIFLPAEASAEAGLDENINLKLVKEGLAIARFYQPDVKYQEEIAQAEEEAISQEIGCKWNKEEFGEEEQGDEENQTEFQWDDLVASKLGFDVVDACEADQYLGREIIVQGKVADAYHHSESNTVFLNFGSAYPRKCFTGVIFSSDLYKFVQKPEDYYYNKTVRITGEVEEYQGQPQIILKDPSQIEIGR